MKGRHLFTSESVSEGHPDKVADQISDAVLDACLAQDPESRVACESFVTTGLALIGGEITTRAQFNYTQVVRDTIRRIGYTDPACRFDADSCAVLNCLGTQSPDIARGVNRKKREEQGAGDQGMMFGFACNETPELMPMPIVLAHRLTKELADARRDKKRGMAWLRPDSKSQVTIEYEDEVPVRIDTIVISTQHSPDVSQKEIHDQVIEKVIAPVLRRPEYKKLAAGKITYHINPTGRFEVGGPHGDAGLTGRKIIVDTYGGRGAHGGGAFSGKDPSKVDRSAAYMGRYLAKNIVAAGLAKSAEIQLAYAIGVAQPVSVHVETDGSGPLSDAELARLIRKVVDLRPHAIIDRLNLLRPIYSLTAAYGHFGRELKEFVWESKNLAKELKAAVK
ncbi:MAG: methionine adenosyltransferase [Candidatus Sumerlaeia bacterium]|nr:methionine adenosyltransferase [Candidatus Sumerlaeia bacterium]